MFVAFIVASAFMSVYHMGVDTIFICFREFVMCCVSPVTVL